MSVLAWAGLIIASVILLLLIFTTVVLYTPFTWPVIAVMRKTQKYRREDTPGYHYYNKPWYWGFYEHDGGFYINRQANLHIQIANAGNMSHLWIKNGPKTIWRGKNQKVKKQKTG